MAFSVFDVKSGKTGIFRTTAQSGSDSVIRHGKIDGLDYLTIDRKSIEPIIANMFGHPKS